MVALEGILDQLEPVWLSMIKIKICYQNILNFWNKNRIYTLAFIQNTTNKDILNAAKSTNSKTGSTGVKTLTDLGVSIYPNPVAEFINIELSNNQPTKVSLVNILGSQLIHKSITTSEKLDVSNFSKGIYFLSIENSTGKATQKIIIK